MQGNNNGILLQTLISLYHVQLWPTSSVIAMSGSRKGVCLKEMTIVVLRRIRRAFKIKKSVRKLGYNKLISDEEQR